MAASVPSVSSLRRIRLGPMVERTPSSVSTWTLQHVQPGSPASEAAILPIQVSSSANQSFAWPDCSPRAAVTRRGAVHRREQPEGLVATRVRLERHGRNAGRLVEERVRPVARASVHKHVGLRPGAEELGVRALDLDFRPEDRTRVIPVDAELRRSQQQDNPPPEEIDCPESVPVPRESSAWRAGEDLREARVHPSLPVEGEPPVQLVQARADAR